MFRSLLVANRGEIAVRIIRTCRKLGIRAVAVYSEADRDALHVREADEAVFIGEAPAAQSYLNVKAIIEAAQRSGSGALHPGYGFLSENPELAKACQEARIVFVGPPPEAMRLLGDKAAARHLAGAHGVPVVPGYDGEDQGIEALSAAAQTIGFPVMIKAAAGGGGRGMRLVQALDDFGSAVESARREATAAFGDGRLLLEKAVFRPRHVEIQFIADDQGNVVTLGERECSIQRRHQKIVEESPSPAVDREMRLRLSEAAATVARAAGYVNAGTAEFLLDRDGAFFFLEVNARLQVEHPVTELVTGVDLVADQIRVAAGLPLPYRQEDVELRGHAIECRLVAEDPRHDYRPSTGLITSLRLSQDDGTRIDAGVAAGDDVSPHYDPMIAKIITHGRNRAEAVTRMQNAIDTAYVGGIRTNLPLLRAIMVSPEFRHGDLNTAFLTMAVNPAEIDHQPPLAVLMAAFGTAAMGISGEDDPWSSGGPWRVGGIARVQLSYDGNTVDMIGRREPGTTGMWSVQLGEARHSVSLDRLGHDSVSVGLGNVQTVFRIQPIARTRRGVGEHGHAFTLSSGGRSYVFDVPVPSFVGPREAPLQDRGLHAPMPGVIVKVFVEQGQKVQAHQPLVALEAMKMEHAIDAPVDGEVTHLHVQVGQQVKEGDLLVEVDAGETV